MKSAIPRFVVALTVLLLSFGALRAAPGYQSLSLPETTIEVKMQGCIPCIAKCNKCVPLTGRGVFASRDACYKDCRQNGSPMIPPTCGVYGGSALCR